MAKSDPLRDALKEIEKEYGAKVETLEDYVPPEPIPTGSLLLDNAIGIGGLPSGRIIELFGPESGGKSSISYMIAGACQRAGHEALWIDAENVHNPFWAAKQGVDSTKLHVVSTVTDEKVLSMEEILGLIEKVVVSCQFKVIVLDSVAALVPSKEFEQDMGDQNVGLQARILSQSLRKLVGEVSKAKCCLIFINQLREKPGVMWGNPETTPGGRALKFYASLRLEVRKLATLGKDGQGNPFGHRMKIKCIKNKVAPPFREAELNFYYDRGVDRVGEVADAAELTGVLSKSGSMYGYKETSWKGLDSVKEALASDEPLAEQMRADVMEALQTRNLPPGQPVAEEA